MDSPSKPRPLSLKQNVVWNGIGSLVYQGCQWLITVLVVILSSNYENSGILAYAMTVGNMFSPVASFNARTFQVSDVDDRFSQQNYIAFRFITIVVALVFSMVYAAVVVQSPAIVVTIGIYLLFKSDEAFVTVLYGIDQRGYRMDYIGVSQTIRGVLVLAVFSAALVFFDSLNLAFAGMTVLCLAVTLFYDVSHARRFERLRPSIDRAGVKDLVVMCLPAVLSTLFCGMVVAVTRQYFGNMFGSEQLGIYAAVATPSVIVQLLAQYLYNPALGPIAEHWAHGTRSGLMAFLLKLVGIMVAVTAVVVIALSLCGDYLLVLVFGQSIADYTFLFPPVLISTGLIALVWFSGDVLIVFRKTALALVMNAVALVVALATMVPLIGAFYMNGINFTVILANGVALVLAVVFIGVSVKRHFASGD